MCADIVKFPGKPETDDPLPAENAAAALEVAFEIHGIILDGIVAGDFDGDTLERSAALYKRLKARYGRDLAHMAEGAFELIYGCDPVTFLEHVTSYGGEEQASHRRKEYHNHRVIN